MATHAIPRFRITTWPNSVRPPAEVAVPRFVGWAAASARPPLPLTLERDASNGTITIQATADGGPDPRAVGRRRERYGFDSDMARSLIDEPKPFDGIWSSELLDAWDSQHRYKPHTEDLIGTARAWLRALDDCVIFAINATDHKVLHDEFVLREFTRLDADDDSQLCDFVRKWGPLEVPNVEGADLSVTPDLQLNNAEVSASGGVPFRGLADPDNVLVWWSLCLSDINGLVADVDAEDWQPKFVSFNDSSTGDFGIKTDASPVRLQRTLMHLYQAVFKSWLYLIQRQADGTKAPRYGAENSDSSLAGIWRTHHFDDVAHHFEDARHTQTHTRVLLEGVSIVLNAGIQPLGPRVEIETLDEPEGGYVIGRPYPRITSALCMQMLAFICDGLPAKICENESCGRYFVRQNGRSVYGQFRTTGVRFCSKLCARAETQRQYRNRKRKGA
jgi:hypothetical protein